MGDIFMNSDIKKLLKGKFVLIMGDSNLRALYRDIIFLLNSNSIIPASHLRRKLDFSYMGDKLLKQGALNRGRDYVEMREYKKDDFHVKFNFLTKCYTVEIENFMSDFKRNKSIPPDIILINSCLWDITRWGPNGVHIYKENMQQLFRIFKTCLPLETLVVFSTTLPVSKSCRGAFLVKQVEFMKHSLRFEVMEANLFARQLVPTFGYNILDFHYHFRMQIHRRAKDGVHWMPKAVRHMTNLFLTHLSLSWNVQLPGNFSCKSLRRMESEVKAMKLSMTAFEMPRFSILPDAAMPPPVAPLKRLRRRKQIKSVIKSPDDVENISPHQGSDDTVAHQPPAVLLRQGLNDIKRVFSSVDNTPSLTYISPKTYDPKAFNCRDAPRKMKRQVKTASNPWNESCNRSRLLPY